MSALTILRADMKRVAVFGNAEDWPENSPVWSSTLESYRVVWLCHRHLMAEYRQMVLDTAAKKRVHHLRSPAEIKAFLAEIQREVKSS